MGAALRWTGLALALLTVQAAVGGGGWQAEAVVANISNVEPRRTADSNMLMDAHDGALWRLANGTYILVAMGYGNCTERRGLLPPEDCPGIYEPFGEGCGFRTNHTLGVYASADLVHWRVVATDALPVATRPRGIYFRPKIIFSPRRQRYVLWINYLPPAATPLAAYPHAGYLVAEATRVGGPYTVVSPHLANVSASGGGDFTLMVVNASSSTPAAFIAYDAWSNSHRVVVEQLTPDFTDSMGQATAPISPPDHEAPILFQRDEWFYLLFGHTCCFCRGGAGSRVFVASHPLGPWSDTGVDINPRADGVGPHRIAAQENYVFQAPLSNGQTAFVYTGDRWGSAKDHLKSHDLQYWEPLRFLPSPGGPGAAPHIAPLQGLHAVPYFLLDLAPEDPQAEERGRWT